MLILTFMVLPSYLLHLCEWITGWKKKCIRMKNEQFTNPEHLPFSVKIWEATSVLMITYAVHHSAININLFLLPHSLLLPVITFLIFSYIKYFWNGKKEKTCAYSCVELEDTNSQLPLFLFAMFALNLKLNFVVFDITLK